ncbi:hypothetical protein [Acaryochloris sp. CCMEE 5410]|uniref:hypothetical protein n=1 Tax=Acaryochloris sp. CCMEE 5410 TaxID=310037 RepID=UPI000314DF96|nr:hypothetical protein [Acaryochloris sp. CCMEE 5410]KAI9133989.1 hypothetical protein ON05_012330 [Acaryochloris sp. CCMEE 5410]
MNTPTLLTPQSQADRMMPLVMSHPSPSQENTPTAKAIEVRQTHDGNTTTFQVQAKEKGN